MKMKKKKANVRWPGRRIIVNVLHINHQHVTHLKIDPLTKGVSTRHKIVLRSDTRYSKNPSAI